MLFYLHAKWVRYFIFNSRRLCKRFGRVGRRIKNLPGKGLFIEVTLTQDTGQNRLIDFLSLIPGVLIDVLSPDCVLTLVSAVN